MSTLIIDLGSHAIRSAWLQDNGAPRSLPDPDASGWVQGGVIEDSVTLPRVSFIEDGPYPGWSSDPHSNDRSWHYNVEQLGQDQPLLDDWCSEWLVALLLRRIRKNAQSQLGVDIKRVLLPQPSGLSRPAKRALQRAALWAGYAEAIVTQAPMATLALYQAEAQACPDGQSLVIDIGHRAVRIDLISTSQSESHIIASRILEDLSGQWFLSELKIYVKNQLEGYSAINNTLRHYDWDYLIAQLVKQIGQHPERSFYQLSLSSATGLIYLNVSKQSLQRWLGPIRDSIESAVTELCQTHSLRLESLNGILLSGAGALLLQVTDFSAEIKRLLRCIQPMQAALSGAAFYRPSLGHFSEHTTPQLRWKIGFTTESKIGQNIALNFNLLVDAGTSLPITVDLSLLNLRPGEEGIHFLAKKHGANDVSEFVDYGAVKLSSQDSLKPSAKIRLTIQAEFEGLLLLKFHDLSQDSERWLLLDSAFQGKSQPTNSIWRHFFM